MPITITVGEGKNRPAGKLLEVEPSSSLGLARILDDEPPRFERWWSPHAWSANYRNGSKWLSACGVAVDLDHVDANGEHCEPSAEDAQRIDELVTRGALPGNLFHRTPRGARVAFVFPDLLRDRAAMQRAMRGAGALLSRALADAELFSFQVDQGALEDLARLFYTPRAVVGGKAREAPPIEASMAT
jgi:hypothetical protein